MIDWTELTTNDIPNTQEGKDGNFVEVSSYHGKTFYVRAYINGGNTSYWVYSDTSVEDPNSLCRIANNVAGVQKFLSVH